MIGIADEDLSIGSDLQFDIIFGETTSHHECTFPITADILGSGLKSNRSKQKTKCQKNFHHQKLRQKIRLKCENCTKGEYNFKQVVITGLMNVSLFTP